MPTLRYVDVYSTLNGGRYSNDLKIDGRRVLARQPDGRWVGVHSHMSLQRGVPQDSHGRRPVKAR